MKNPRAESGNLLVILAVVLTALFAVAGLAIDSAVYLARREELRSLAERAAVGAALNLPVREAAERSAESWLALLQAAEYRSRRTGEDRRTEIKILDHHSGTNPLSPYRVNAVRVHVEERYRPRIFPIGVSGNTGIRIVGEAQAGLSPRDVILVFDNSASLIAGDTRLIQAFSAAYPPALAGRYSEQCFAPPVLGAKLALVALYDQLSQVGTFRVGLIQAASRSGAPLVLANLGETVIPLSRLEYDGDLPDRHSMRCALGTKEPRLAVIPNPNSWSGAWSASADISQLPIQSADVERRLLAREALWIWPAGYSTDSGYIPLRYYYQDALPALIFADALLARSHTGASKQTVVLVTDRSGLIPDGLGVPQAVQTICARWKADSRHSSLIVLYLDHGQSEQLSMLRSECNRLKIPLVVSDIKTNVSEPADTAASLIALGLKEAQSTR